MNHAQRLLTRTFKTSKPIVDDIDDLADVEKSFRTSSFAFLPSAATPSRAPSNSLIASSQAAFFKARPCFRIPDGQDKWPEVDDWHNDHGSKYSTAIEKIQLRKDHQHPYYHECIVIYTSSGHTYRVDRRPDANAPFDTIMREGCTAYDTIEEVDLLSLNELDGKSDCVVELHWRGEPTINLLFVLSVCFRIHNDKWAKRYTLQHYNCYFLSWTIIMIIVRNTTTLELGAWPKVLQNWSVDQGQDQDQEQQLGRLLGWERGREIELEQQLEQEQERMRRQGQGQEQESILALVQEHVQETEQARVRIRVRVWEPLLLHELERELERVRVRIRVRGQALDRVQRRTLALAHILAHMPLVLIWQLAQDWIEKKTDVLDELRELLRTADTGFLPGELKTWMKDDSGSLEWLSNKMDVVMIQMMEQASGDICRTLSDLAVLPGLFSVTFNNRYLNPKSNALGSDLYELTSTKLEQYIIAVIENHARRVDRWKLGSRAEVGLVILDGMWRTWQDMSRIS